MFEAPAFDGTGPAGGYFHHCLVCGDHAAFGFTTRRGTIWTCVDHRDGGERELQAPAMGSRSTTGSG